jgi:hypothetical protein
MLRLSIRHFIIAGFSLNLEEISSPQLLRHAKRGAMDKLSHRI